MNKKPFIASDKLGVEAIVWLQAQAGIKETKKKALAHWKKMEPAHQQVTMRTYEDLSGKKNLLWKRPIMIHLPKQLIR